MASPRKVKTAAKILPLAVRPIVFHAVLAFLDLDFEHDRMGIEDGLFRLFWINVMALQVANVGVVPIKCRLLYYPIVTTLSIQKEKSYEL
jgi:hypothetical protein